MASRWEGVRLPRASGKPPDFPGSSPNFPGSFFGDFPGSSLTVELSSNPGFPGSFPDFPGSSPDFPGSSPDFPGGQPLSLGSLTPSPDSKLSLKKGRQQQLLPLGWGWGWSFLAWPPLQSLAVKNNFFLCEFWAVKNFLKFVEKCR